MLRLTTVINEAQLVRVKVEGTITQPALPVLVEELKAALAGQAPIQLDFRDVVYVDAAALELLRNLPQDRVEIVDCTPLIRELLSKELT
jgi:ABC-type transporter Mla MlaB component